jgi:L-threonylcarbamoyladenylate synthase
MLTIKVSGRAECGIEQAAVKAAVSVLRRGGVIAYPTETTYGLGCDPRNAKAIAGIFSIKGRDRKKPFLLVAADVKQVKSVAHLVGANIRSPLHDIIRRHWPGPLTLVLPVRVGAIHELSPPIRPNREIAIRVSSDGFVQAVCRAYGSPIVSTSANRSGEPDCRSGRAVRRIFAGTGKKPDLLIDAGVLPRRKPSTVARVKPDGTVEILRQGAVRLA